MKTVFKLRPVYKDYLWGGNLLKELYNKKSDLKKTAESWEVSVHEDGLSVIDSGIYKGMTFKDYCKSNFPLLIKFIDAEKSLSVQVHPDEEYAVKYENDHGKNELWYIVKAKENAYIYLGFDKDTDEKEIRERIKDNTLTDILHKEYVKEGDVFYIPSGTVHAINEGIVILEVQETSNITYRLYDYSRKDDNGNLRILHIDKALDVLKYEKYKKEPFDFCEIDRTDKITDTGKMIAVCLDGRGYLEDVEITKGDTVYIETDDTIRQSGDMALLKIAIKES